MPGLCKRNAVSSLGRVAPMVADGLGLGGRVAFSAACNRGYVARPESRQVRTSDVINGEVM